jgi:hypothetical protein
MKQQKKRVMHEWESSPANVLPRKALCMQMWAENNARQEFRPRSDNFTPQQLGLPAAFN